MEDKMAAGASDAQGIMGETGPFKRIAANNDWQ